MLLSHFVPCRQDVSSVRFFACTISVRAYQTAPPCQICKTFDAPVLCAAMADVLRTGLHVQNSRVQRISQHLLLHSVHNSACTVEGRIAAPATLVALLHQWNQCIPGRAAELASTYAALRLQLGLRRSNCCTC